MPTSRIVLAVLIGLVGTANLASAFATSFAIVLVARFLIGIDRRRLLNPRRSA
ncbi:hypothetical protein SAURM35S_01838 [Streptomyces aurantiogriseus]